MIDLSIIIPIRNEARRLPASMLSVTDWAANQPFTTEIILVENGSTDITYEIASQYLGNKHIRLLRSDPGKGAAVRVGMLAAMGAARLMTDCDLSVSPDQWYSLINNNADVAIATREGIGAIREDETMLRHLSGRVFNWATQMILPELSGIHDTQCGCKLFSSYAADYLFGHQQQTGWAFDIEILSLAVRNGYRIEQVPVRWVNDRRSLVNLWPDSLDMLLDVWSIRDGKRSCEIVTKRS